MEIIIIGDGKVGHALARRLDEEGHDVSIVDLRGDLLENTVNSLDVTGIQGSGTDVDTLKKAGIARADLLIAATSADEVNLVSCLLGKKLGAQNTIARVRSPEYYKSSWLLKDELRLSMLMNPELAAATEVVRKLRFTTNIAVSSFSKGRMEMARFVVQENSPLAGQSVQQATSRLKSEVLFCILEHGQEVHIPSGTSVIQAGDKLSVTGSSKQLEKFFREIGMYKKRRLQEVMIVGGARMTWYLVPQLLELGIDVRIIENNQKKAEELAAKFPKATVICGDGTDQALLLQENLEDMDAFVVLTGNDEENVIAAMYASSKGVNNVLPKINRVEGGFTIRII